MAKGVTEVPHSSSNRLLIPW